MLALLTDADADEAIRLWLEGDLSKEIAEKFDTSGGYISRLLRIGAERLRDTRSKVCELGL